MTVVRNVSGKKLYRQVSLRAEAHTQVAWIPSGAAHVGNRLTLDEDTVEGRIWTVEEIYGTMTVDDLVNVRYSQRELAGKLAGH